MNSIQLNIAQFKNSFFLIAIIFFSSTSIYSQNEAASLKDSIKKNYYSNPNKGKNFCKKILSLNNKEKFAKERIISYCYLSDFCNVLGQKDSVFYYFDQASFELKDSKNYDLQIILNINKGNYFFNQYDYDSALKTYDNVLLLANKINDDYVKGYISIKKADILYEIEKYNDALNIYLENLKNPNLKSFNNQLDIKLGLARTYIKLKKPDLALNYIETSIKESKEHHLKEHEVYFLCLLGKFYIDKNEYRKSEVTLNKALISAQKYHNLNLNIYVSIELSRLFIIKKDYEKAISTINSYLTEKNIPKEYLTEIYYLLAESNKALNKIEDSNDFFSLFIHNSKTIGQKKIDTIDHLNKIEISEIEKREKLQSDQKRLLLYTVIVLILIFLFILFQIKLKERKDQIKFEKLIDKIQKYELDSSKLGTKANESSPIDDESNLEDQKVDYIEDPNDLTDDLEENFVDQGNNSDDKDSNYEAIIIKEETITEILDKLLKLEERKEFLKQDFTLHRVAKKLKTNTTYLSKVINSELNKSFSTYVNELRINYIVIELKNNPKLRSYSIKAIAEEIGYKSPESFTKYFKAATGISPSVYIKKINKS